MRGFICILIFLGFLPVASGQGYPYPISALANTGDSVVNLILSSAETLDSSCIDSFITNLETLRQKPGLNNRQKAAALTIIGYLHVAKGERDNAFPFYRKALPLVKDLSRKDIVYSIVQGNYGMYMAHYQVFDIAIPYLKEAIPGLAALNTDGSFKEDGLYEAVIQSYYATGQEDSALVYQQKMVEAASTEGNAIEVSQAYNDAGLYFTATGNYEKAFEYFQQGLKVLDTSDRTQLFYYLNILESRAHPTIHIGYFEKGIADLKYVFQTRKRLHELKHAMQALAYIINYHLDEKKFQEVYSYIYPELDLFLQPHSINTRSAPAYLAIADLYRHMGMPDKALPFVHTYNQFMVDKIQSEGLLDPGRSNLNAYMTFRNQAYEQGLELERLESEKLSQHLRQSRLLIALLSILLVLLIVLVYLIGKWKKTQRHKNLELEKKHNETLTLRNQNLKYALQLKEKDIKRIAADNKIRTSLKRKFLRQLKGLKTFNNGQLQKELSGLIHSLEHTIDNQEQLSLLQDKIEQINTSFEEQLREKIAGISAQEIKLCSLIKIGMSNQDIAKLLNKGDSTIRSYKYRLKKKAGLDSVRELELTIMDL